MQQPLQNTHFSFFFFNDTATTAIYTLSLHDALPIYQGRRRRRKTDRRVPRRPEARVSGAQPWPTSSGSTPKSSTERSRGPRSSCSRRPRSSAPPKRDRKSTRLNSSHGYISYAVFCLK